MAWEGISSPGIGSARGVDRQKGVAMNHQVKKKDLITGSGPGLSCITDYKTPTGRPKETRKDDRGSAIGNGIPFFSGDIHHLCLGGIDRVLETVFCRTPGHQLGEVPILHDILYPLKV